MLNFYDDYYEAVEYPCSGCDEKDYKLKETAKELSAVLQCVLEIKKTHTLLENKLLDSLEEACLAAGIPFKWS